MDPFVWLAIGLIMIFLEFFIPGAIMGITGVVFVTISLVLFAYAASSPIYVVIYTTVVILLLIGTFKFALWRIRSTRNENTLFLSSDQEGYHADGYNTHAIGKEGVATTDLRPAGRISVEGNTYQAISQGGFIPNGTAIIVISGEGPTLIVKPLKKDAKL